MAIGHHSEEFQHDTFADNHVGNQVVICSGRIAVPEQNGFGHRFFTQGDSKMKIQPAFIYAQPRGCYDGIRDLLETTILRTAPEADELEAAKLEALQAGFNEAIKRERLHDMAPLALRIERQNLA